MSRPTTATDDETTQPTNRYADVEHALDTLATLATQYDEGTLLVVTTDVVIRGDTIDELRERNVFDRTETVLTIVWDATPYGVTTELHFHENQLESTFTFGGSGGDWTAFSDLNDTFARIIEDFRDADVITAPVSPTEIRTGSLAASPDDNGADREFTYETTLSQRALQRLTD